MICTDIPLVGVGAENIATDAAYALILYVNLLSLQTFDFFIIMYIFCSQYNGHAFQLLVIPQTIVMQ